MVPRTIYKVDQWAFKVVSENSQKNIEEQAEQTAESSKAGVEKVLDAFGKLTASERVRLILMYTYCVHIVSNAIAGSCRTGSVMYIIETLTYTIRSNVAMLSFSYVCFKGSEWLSLKRRLELTDCKAFKRRAQIKRKVIRAIVFVYCVLLMFTTALFFVLVPAQKYFDKCFYGLLLKENGIPDALAILIGLTEWNWYNILVTTSPFLIADLILLCDYMRAQIKDYRAICAKKDLTDIDELQNLTTSLTTSMRLLDSFYSPLILLWCLDLLTNVVLPIRTLVNGIASFTLANVMHFFIEAFYSITFFLLMTFSLAEIAREAKSTDECLYRLRIDVPRSNFVEVYSKLSLLESGLTSCKFTIGGLGLFEVDRSFILTLTGAVVTYTIVLLQLAPGDTY